MHKCSFCGHTLKKGAGKMFVKPDGKVLYFCDSKCDKNFFLGRTGKEKKWTKLYQAGKKPKKKKKKRKK